MKRLRRILFKGLTVASAVLFIATAALWVRSYGQVDAFQWQSRWKLLFIRSTRGVIHYSDSSDWITEPQGLIFDAPSIVRFYPRGSPPDYSDEVSTSRGPDNQKSF